MSPIDNDANTLEPGEPDEPLHDEGIRKALAQAPDRSKLPDWRVRQAILDQAHDAISASEELLAASREGAPWWRLAWWRDKVGFTGATPWNAAFATVIVGVLVTLMWQREPVPGARLDERPAASAPAAKEEATRQEAERAAPLAPASPPPAAESKSAGTPAPAAPPARARAPAPAPVAPEVPAAPSSPAPAPDAPTLAAAPPPPAAAPPVLAPAPSQIYPPAGESAGAGSSPRFAQGSVAPPKSSAADAAAERRKSEPSVAAAPPPPPALPDARRGARQESAAAAQPGARTDVPPPMPDFASLSRWTELRVANVNGDVRIVPRAEAGELSLLMSSAAIMSTGAPPMRTLPEWRVSLERKGQVLAVLEVARTQVRWTEGPLPATTGTPPIESLDALRAALRQTARAGSPARVEPVAPPVRAPRAARPEAPPAEPPPAKE